MAMAKIFFVPTNSNSLLALVNSSKDCRQNEIKEIMIFLEAIGWETLS